MAYFHSFMHTLMYIPTLPKYCYDICVFVIKPVIFLCVSCFLYHVPLVISFTVGSKVMHDGMAVYK